MHCTRVGGAWRRRRRHSILSTSGCRPRGLLALLCTTSLHTKSIVGLSAAPTAFSTHLDSVSTDRHVAPSELLRATEDGDRPQCTPRRFPAARPGTRQGHVAAPVRHRRQLRLSLWHTARWTAATSQAPPPEGSCVRHAARHRYATIHSRTRCSPAGAAHPNCHPTTPVQCPLNTHATCPPRSCPPTPACSHSASPASATSRGTFS